MCGDLGREAIYQRCHPNIAMYQGRGIVILCLWGVMVGKTFLRCSSPALHGIRVGRSGSGGRARGPSRKNLTPDSGDMDLGSFIRAQFPLTGRRFTPHWQGMRVRVGVRALRFRRVWKIFELGRARSEGAWPDAQGPFFLVSNSPKGIRTGEGHRPTPGASLMDRSTAPVSRGILGRCGHPGRSEAGFERPLRLAYS